MQANNYSQFMKFEQNVCKNNAYLSAFFCKRYANYAWCNAVQELHAKSMQCLDAFYEV